MTIVDFTGFTVEEVFTGLYKVARSKCGISQMLGICDDPMTDDSMKEVLGNVSNGYSVIDIDGLSINVKTNDFPNLDSRCYDETYGENMMASVQVTMSLARGRDNIARKREATDA